MGMETLSALPIKKLILVALKTLTPSIFLSCTVCLHTQYIHNIHTYVHHTYMCVYVCTYKVDVLTCTHTVSGCRERPMENLRGQQGLQHV